MIILISILLCIICHELAHLTVALLVKCKVSKLGIGFGKPIIFRFKIFNIPAEVSPWLLGGYVNLDDETTYSRSPHSFTNLPYRKKFAIIIAGCAINIKMGLTALALVWFGHLRSYDMIYNLYVFGVISLSLGISNLIPIMCLDGGYLVWMPLFMRIYGKRKGLKIFDMWCRWSFKVVMILNILCLPYLVIMIIQGMTK